MLDIITKEEYFAWLDKGYGATKSYTLKGIQDAFILSILKNVNNMKIAEIGGGQSRVLGELTKKNECWNIDKIEGDGNGPKEYDNIPGVKLVDCFLGEFSSKLPSNYFDIVFSISVVEHVPPDNLNAFFTDIARIMKNKASCIHAIDVYLGDADFPKENIQIDIYRDIGIENGIPLKLIDKPKINAASLFSCRYATNSDITIYKWNKSVPSIKNMRNKCQSVSIKAIWEKTENIVSSDKEIENKEEMKIPSLVSSELEAKKLYNKYSKKVAAKMRDALNDALDEGMKLVLVYQMGKVGSASIKSLLRKNENLKVLHLHRLNQSSNDMMIDAHIRNSNIQLALQEREWKEISIFLQEKKPLVHIITAMRDPIARNISAFFQNINLEIINKYSVGQLIDKFMKTYPHTIPTNWFDKQFAEVFGINIFNYPFNKRRGWDLLANENYKCLLLTAEIHDNKKLKAVNRLLGLKIKTFTRTNVGDEKEYAKIYKEFKVEIKIPEGYIEKMLNSQVVKHFYTDRQINKFYKKWSCVK